MAASLRRSKLQNLPQLPRQLATPSLFPSQAKNPKTHWDAAAREGRDSLVSCLESRLTEIDSYVQLKLCKALGSGWFPSTPAGDGKAERIAAREHTPVTASRPGFVELPKCNRQVILRRSLKLNHALDKRALGCTRAEQQRHCRHFKAMLQTHMVRTSTPGKMCRKDSIFKRVWLAASHLVGFCRKPR